MKLKIYERTGIKEKNTLKDSQIKLIEKNNSEEQIRSSIERGIYKANCKDMYDLNLMSYKKEYEKTKNFLKQYQEMSVIYNENIQTLIEGYINYFNAYGNNMDALGLRGFRKSIEKVIILANKVEKMKKKEIELENKIIDFIIANGDKIEYFGEEIDIPNIIDLMYELGLSSRNQREYVKIKTKVKTIYDELYY